MVAVHKLIGFGSQRYLPGRYCRTLAHCSLALRRVFTLPQEDRWHVAIVIHFVSRGRFTASETALSHCMQRLMLTFLPALMYFTAAHGGN